MDVQRIAHQPFLGNELQAYGIALIILVGSFFIIRVLKSFLLSHLKTFTERTPSKLDDFLLKVGDENLFPLFYFAAFYFAAKQLVLNVAVDQLLHSILMIALTVQGIRVGLAVFIYFLKQTSLKKEKGSGGTAVSKSVLTITKTTVWGVGAVFLLDNLGFNVAAIVAGLGIAGVAVALACQTILGDLFNYFVIFFDKPFREGDFIVVGDYMGTIEDIGIKSTRIRALSGEEIIVSNSNLTSQRIHNYKSMNQRRVEFTFKVSHETAQGQLKKIPGMVRTVIEGMEKVKFDRSNVKEIQDMGVLIETVYLVLSEDYNKYMDIHEQITLEIRERLLHAGVEYASFKAMLHFQEMVQEK